MKGSRAYKFYFSTVASIILQLLAKDNNSSEIFPKTVTPAKKKTFNPNLIIIQDIDELPELHQKTCSGTRST